MKDELLHYLAGLCQAASAALLASAIIMPPARTESLIGSAVTAIIGAAMTILKSRGKRK